MIGLLFFLLYAQDAEDDEEDGEEDEEEEPERANDDYFIYLALYAFVFYIIDDVEDADAGSFFPSDLGKVSVAWHNPADFRVFFIGKNFFAGEERVNLEDLSVSGVDIAFIRDGGGTVNIAREEEAWDIDIGDISLSDRFASHFGVDEVAHLKDFVNTKAFLGSRILFGADRN